MITDQKLTLISDDKASWTASLTSIAFRVTKTLAKLSKKKLDKINEREGEEWLLEEGAEIDNDKVFFNNRS